MNASTRGGTSQNSLKVIDSYTEQESHVQQSYSFAARGGNNSYGKPNMSISGRSLCTTADITPLAYSAGCMAGSNDDAILNDCTAIRTGIDQINSDVKDLSRLRQRILDGRASTSSATTETDLDALRGEIDARWRGLAERSRFQTVKQDQLARQYHIVGRDPREEDVHAAAANTRDEAVFTQALMQSDRQGRAVVALSEVQARHNALVKMEQQLVELSTFIQHIGLVIADQEAPVMQIESKGEDAVRNINKGCEEITDAVDTARRRRRKKWICLGICIVIIVLIVVVVIQ
ncbi:syntaxin [Cordyceps javanica]|uniref:Syntaxin n=1 Tax=Cordyceps javanica TaxID=43265 RepID=A0A545UL13_9HYPO|nr:syntaxin [Cordyceps javanica]TQW01649.1 syntaxin [Cordyceps javanica]